MVDNTDKSRYLGEPCDVCGSRETRDTSCASGTLCNKHMWEHRDSCEECMRFFVEDQAMLRAWRYAHKHPDR